MVASNAVRENMEVVTTCGTIVGRVERVEGRLLKLAACGPKSRNRQYWVPCDWIETIDESVHLNKNLSETIRFEQPVERPTVARRRSDARKPKSRLRMKPVCF